MQPFPTFLGPGLAAAILGKRTWSTWGTETGRDALADGGRGGQHRQGLAGQGSPRDNVFPSRYAGNLWGARRDCMRDLGPTLDLGSRCSPKLLQEKNARGKDKHGIPRRRLSFVRLLGRSSFEFTKQRSAPRLKLGAKSFQPSARQSKSDRLLCLPSFLVRGWQASSSRRHAFPPFRCSPASPAAI